MKKKNIFACDVSSFIADNKQDGVYLEPRQCLFEFLFWNDISSVAAFICSEPENAPHPCKIPPGTLPVTFTVFSRRFFICREAAPN